MTMSHVSEMLFRLARCRPAVRVDRLESIWGERIEPLANTASAGNDRLPESGRSRDAW